MPRPGFRASSASPVAPSTPATRRPDLSRRDRQERLEQNAAIIDALQAAGFNLAALAEIAGARRLEATDPEPEVMLVRHLGLPHLGRWIYLPGRPALAGPQYVAEPTLVATAGRLVGIRPSKAGTRDAVSTRTLVVLQGPAAAELSVRVDDRVDVAPREWTP
jgi:hypothetical protein